MRQSRNIQQTKPVKNTGVTARKAAQKPAGKKAADEPKHKNEKFALRVAKWVQAEDRAVTAADVAERFSLELWQARKLLHYMMTVPGIVACLDWGYPQDTDTKENPRPTRLFSIVRGTTVGKGK